MPSFIYKNKKFGGVTPRPEEIGMGKSDISKIGDGTLTGAIETLNTNKLENTGDSKDNITTFTSSDTSTVSEWTDVETISSGETHASIFSKISQMVKNVRYLWKLIGKTDISKIGDGTATGALSTLNTNKLGKTETAAAASKLSNTSAIGSATKPVYFNANGVPVAGSYELNKTVPNDAVFTDTKNTAGSTDSSSKLFLIGATSQAANPQTYSQDTAYVGTDGCVYSGGTKTSVVGHKHTKSEITDFPSSLKNPNALSINGKTYDGSSAVNVGAIGASYGGTGKTSLVDSANALINALSTGADTPVDTDYYIAQYVNGGASTTTYHKRPISKLWEYIKGKISSTSIIPAATNTYDIGSVDKYFNKAYVNLAYLKTIYTDTLTTSGDIEPSRTGYYSIGTLSKRFNQVYAQSIYPQNLNITDSNASPKGNLYYSNNIGTMYSSTGSTKSDTIGVTMYSYDNIRLTGNRIYFNATTSVSASTGIATASDKKVKIITEELDTDKEKLIKLFDIMQVKSYRYRYSEDNRSTLGFIAQEFEQACDDIGIDIEKYKFLSIHYNYFLQRGEDEDSKYYTKFYEISYNDIFNLSLLKMESMVTEYNDLEKKYTDLEARLLQLESKIL